MKHLKKFNEDINFIKEEERTTKYLTDYEEEQEERERFEMAEEEEEQEEREERERFEREEDERIESEEEEDDNDEVSTGDHIRDIMTENNPIKLSIRQKFKIFKAGLSTNYRVFGNELQFTKINQRSGSEIGNITKHDGKYKLYKFLSSDGLIYDDLDKCIDDMINMNPTTFYKLINTLKKLKK